MYGSVAQRKEAQLDMVDQDLAALAARGVRIVGNVFSDIVLVKGELNADELAGAELLSGTDGAALRSALGAMGYAPEDFCALAAVAGSVEDPTGAQEGEALPTELFRYALETLDPEAVVLLDTTAADLLRESYADALVAIEDFDTAMLKPGLVAHVLGRRVLALDGFEAALEDKREKQRMWAYLRQLAPAGAPY